jgi:hypothetical protein
MSSNSLCFFRIFCCCLSPPFTLHSLSDRIPEGVFTQESNSSTQTEQTALLVLTGQNLQKSRRSVYYFNPLRSGISHLTLIQPLFSLASVHRCRSQDFNYSLSLTMVRPWAHLDSKEFNMFS